MRRMSYFLESVVPPDLSEALDCDRVVFVVDLAQSTSLEVNSDLKL